MRKKYLQTAKIFCLALVTAAGVLAGASTVKAGNSFNTADQVQVNGIRKEINFANSDASQYFKFTTDAAAGWYSVNFSRYATTRKSIQIYEGPNTSYNKVLDITRYGDGNDSYLLSLLPGRTYYIVCNTGGIGGKSSFTLTKINDDYKNTLDASTAISIGQTVTGDIEVSDKGEADTFRFTTTSNDSFYEMSLACTGSNSALAYIYEGNDESYNHVDIYAGSAETNYLTKRLERNKVYYVKIVGNYWDDATSYKFTVKEIKDDAGSDFSDATKITNKKNVAKEIQIDNDADFFKFKTGNKNTAYQFYFKNRSKYSMYVTIYSNNDIASAVNDLNEVYVGDASVRTFCLNMKKNHTYYVKVTGEGGCDYTLNFKDMNTLVKKSTPSISVKRPYTYAKYASVTWKNKYSNAVYEIYRSTSKNSGYKKIKTIKNQTGDTIYFYNYNLKGKRTYYYKMRYYIKDNGKKVYSKWSKVKSVKIK